MRCISLCTATSYQLRHLPEIFRENGYITTFHFKVLHATHPLYAEDFFVFENGCVIYWCHHKNKKLFTHIMKRIKRFEVAPNEQIEQDHFIFKYGEETRLYSHARFNVDVIILESDNVNIKLAISSALAQSVKLESYATTAQNIFIKNLSLPEELATRGKISLPRVEISKRMGEIFLARSSVNLSSEYLYVPKHIWQNPTLESRYTLTANFLEIERRVKIVNQKLDILHGTLDILSTELQHRHSSILEMIIIALIFIEIVLTISHW